MLRPTSWDTVSAGCGLLDEWQAWEQAGGLAERTIRERDTIIKAICKGYGIEPEALSSKVIIHFIARPELSATTKATYHASIRAFCSWMVRTGRWEVDPTVCTPVPKRPRGFPRPVRTDQLAAMLAATGKRRTRMMILLAAYAGLRVHEIAKIRGDDVDPVMGVLYVNGKGGKEACIPLHPAIVAAAAGFPPSGWWFPNYLPGGGHVLPGAVSKAIHRCMVRAGVQGSPHQLRHWYGTALVSGGADLRTVQELMRHSSLATTQIYTQVSDASRRRAIDGLTIVRERIPQ